MAVRELRGKHVLITGASSGIGRDLAVQLAAAGAELVIAARRGEKLAELESEIKANGGVAFTSVADVTLDEDRKKLLAECRNHFGGLDILINNAALERWGVLMKPIRSV